MNFVLKIASFFAKILPNSIKQWLYRSPILAKRIRATLNKAAPHGFTIVTIAGGNLEGYQFKLDMQTEKDYWLGTYEIDLQRKLKQFCKPDMVVYDVGANVGYFSLMFADLVGKGGKVFSFEPLPENFNRLLENIKINQLQPHISTHQAAVVDNSGKTKFLVHQSGAMGKAIGSKGREEQYHNELVVDALALDDFVFRHNNPAPNLIKMDIEGGETLAIHGMSKILGEVKPVLFIEIHSHSAFVLVGEFLVSKEYQLYQIDNDQAPITDFQNTGDRDYVIAIPIKKGQ